MEEEILLSSAACRRSAASACKHGSILPWLCPFLETAAKSSRWTLSSCLHQVAERLLRFSLLILDIQHLYRGSLCDCIQFASDHSGFVFLSGLLSCWNAFNLDQPYGLSSLWSLTVWRSANNSLWLWAAVSVEAKWLGSRLPVVLLYVICNHHQQWRTGRKRVWWADACLMEKFPKWRFYWRWALTVNKAAEIRALETVWYFLFARFSSWLPCLPLIFIHYG